MANSVKRSEKGKKLYAKYRNEDRRAKNRGRVTRGHAAPMCQNCYTTQGPFTRSSVGTKTMQIILIGCKNNEVCHDRRQTIDAKRYPQSVA